MKADADGRLENIRITEAEGETSSEEEIAHWLLTVLSGGNVGTYALDVIARAQKSAKDIAV